MWAAWVMASAVALAACGEDPGYGPWELTEGELCTPDDTSRACYDGPVEALGRGGCRRGVSTCGGQTWGECLWQVLPEPEVCNGADDDCDGEVDEGVTLACGLCPSQVPERDACGDGLDNDCDGAVDEGCACVLEVAPCYTGPPVTRGVGACRDGTQRCERGVVGACVGSVLPATERCNNGLDDDCDGAIDEDCAPCVTTRPFAGETRWQVHTGGGPVCWGQDHGRHGDPRAYASAVIPAQGDAGWRDVAEERIRFDSRSALCGAEPGDEPVCACRLGGDFTYFQTFLRLGEAQQAREMRVRADVVDDGVRVTVFNARHPDGVVDPQGFVYLGGGESADLSEYLVTGLNRIVLTHVDDCCQQRSLQGVSVTIGGVETVECE
jgi:hypothetical protein